jgi:hypothetical protein
VEEALGVEVAEAIPELLRLTVLEVRIPRMEVVTLERLAAVDGMTVSAVFSRELLGVVSVHSGWLSREVPGFAAAFAWPEVADIPRWGDCDVREGHNLLGMDGSPVESRTEGVTPSPPRPKMWHALHTRSREGYSRVEAAHRMSERLHHSCREQHPWMDETQPWIERCSTFVSRTTSMVGCNSSMDGALTNICVANDIHGWMRLIHG